MVANTMKWIKVLSFSLITVLLVAVLVGYAVLSASLPQYEGSLPVAVIAPVAVERDQLGHLTIKADSRTDAAYALGFAHGQERFFQMDLLRRNSAGELAELFGPVALPLDKQRRMHRFRDRAETLLQNLPSNERELLTRYTAGVNAGLQQLALPPFEYSVLFQKPRPWQETDSLLVVFSMYLDLQNSEGRDELAQGVFKATIPSDWYAFFNQHSADWQAAIDATTVTAIPMPTSAYPEVLRQQLQACLDCSWRDSRDIGSNNFAVAAHRSQTGKAILADDMHLGMQVPGIWYKARIKVNHPAPLDISGVTLPGTPLIIAGSNGHIAWGFTNSTADWLDVIQLQAGSQPHTYLTPAGEQEFSYNNEVIRVKGQADEVILIKETQWGPVMPAPFEGFALRWVAHDSAAVNLGLAKLEQATTVDQAIAIAPTVGIPAQNLLVADSAGEIGWTLIGPIPRRTLLDMDTPQDWSQGQNFWQGYLSARSYPAIKNPESGVLWTANARTVGGRVLRRIGDGGYDLGARGQQIRDALLATPMHNIQSVHQIQLDDRAIFLKRWQQLLLNQLTDDFVAQHQLADYREWVANDSDRASTSAIGYSLVRAFRDETLEIMFAPLASLLEAQQLRLRDLKMIPETAGWALLQARRADTLPSNFTSWDTLLQQAILQSREKLIAQVGPDLQQARWGKLNETTLQHPLSKAIPVLGLLLDMPTAELAGDRHMPRVQRPSHGQSQRLVVSPGEEASGILTLPTGQSGHPLSPFYRSDFAFWRDEAELSMLPGPQKYLLELQPNG